MLFILKIYNHLGHFLTKITKNGPNTQKWLEEGSPWPLIVPMSVAVKVAVEVAADMAAVEAAEMATRCLRRSLRRKACHNR